MAKNSIGKHAVYLSASYGRLKSGLNNAWGHISGFASRVKGSFAGSLVAASAGLAGVGLAASFDQLSAKIDKTAKTARALGTTSQYFAGLQHAADMSGVKAEKLESGLRRFRFLVDGPLDQALAQFADRIAGMDDPAERARLAMTQFGEAGLAMIPLFEGGSGAIADMIAEAERLGIALTDTDAAKFEAANDALTRVKVSVEGLYTGILVQVAPTIESWANRFSKLVSAAKPFIDLVGNWYGTQLKIVEALLIEIETVISSIVAEVQAWTESFFGTVSTIEVIESINKAVAKSIATIVIYTVRWGAALAAIPATILGQVIEDLESIKAEIVEVIRLGSKYGFFGAAGMVWGEDLAEGLENTRLDKIGRDLQDWGGKQWNALDGIGQELANVDKWLDRVLAKKNDLAKPERLKLDRDESVTAGLGGALIRGSSAEVSARARFDAGLMTTQREQLRELQRIRQGIEKPVAPPPPALKLEPM